MNIAEVLSTGGSFFHSRPTKERGVVDLGDLGELLKQELKQFTPDLNFESIQALVEKHGGSLELIADEDETFWTLIFKKPIGLEQQKGSKTSITNSSKEKIMQSAYWLIITSL
ncbi:MAG: hypothetical protein A2383_03575 [Candidatus Pacebacteria bacterium RIFOXYB1_FULL_39_46]|nr:MAG: hypothetical protein A2182_03830 [Candidatus Pacebacteria bacterium RIFOXYA1_FULL_38_18]OGJ38496.1 MAG: hypothetical protein A2383_03575 [Candidatus Pacebacteria bacterium RIFOXYB1_FULL_39_46]OGJ40356.1 MAG: hypothetical protein A2411_03715 [Candidatus Pacebacteria bacterium RIFOXYC1_FULL_39_21]OGJ40475.1 MAG: hypothetical protein A2582_02460 [Candidatus Pacebacteria bacterium RIFOXYD1_FULL_39_27]